MKQSVIHFAIEKDLFFLPKKLFQNQQRSKLNLFSKTGIV